MVKHCKWLLEAGGCDAVNLLGTTGEATSFSLKQRLEAMSHIQIGASDVSVHGRDRRGSHRRCVALTKAADDLGFAGALLVPPFYYKGISEEAVMNYVQTCLRQVS